MTLYESHFRVNKSEIANSKYSYEKKRYFIGNT